MKIYKDSTLIKILKYQTYLMVKLQNVLITFLKKNTMELVTWIRQYLLKGLERGFETEEIILMVLQSQSIQEKTEQINKRNQ